MSGLHWNIQAGCVGCKTSMIDIPEGRRFLHVYCSEVCHDKHKAKFGRKMDAHERLKARRMRKAKR